MASGLQHLEAEAQISGLLLVEFQRPSGYQVLTFGLTCHQGCDKLFPEGGLLEKV